MLEFYEYLFNIYVYFDIIILQIFININLCINQPTKSQSQRNNN
jgi:hypothetical protein